MPRCRSCRLLLPSCKPCVDMKYMANLYSRIRIFLGREDGCVGVVVAVGICPVAGLALIYIDTEYIDTQHLDTQYKLPHDSPLLVVAQASKPGSRVSRSIFLFFFISWVATIQLNHLFKRSIEFDGQFC